MFYSPLYRNKVSMERLLGDIERDNNSMIIAAKATSMFYFLKKNESVSKSDASEDVWNKTYDV